MFKLLLFDSLIILYIVFDNLCDNFSSKLDVTCQKRSEILEVEEFKEKIPSGRSQSIMMLI